MQISQNNNKKEEVSHVYMKGISEYIMPEPDEEFHVETSTDKNDTSDEVDFELIHIKEAFYIIC